MSYVWETELQPSRYDADDNLVWRAQHHLKKVLVPTEEFGRVREYKITVAWVTKYGDRKWDCQFVNHDGSRTFRSLKAAMAYAVAIITLEN